MTNTLLNQIEDCCFDGMYQLACNCYGATVTCALDILALLRNNDSLGTEITADLQHLADEVLVLKSQRDNNRMREAAVQFKLIRENLQLIRQSLQQTGQLPANWRACRASRPVYERITMVDQEGSETILYDRKQQRGKLDGPKTK